ncbi:hypothetical protein FRC12_011919 [Ceratobasidium sp. 428]|nr:hypothetical protein FRC12_011919 [Ceratobasidium sp. 428]
MSSTNENQQQSYFQPPPGGDIILCSSDGAQFHVHSVILSIASSVFHGMFTVGTSGNGQAINLTEDGRTLSLMLGFIYPIQRLPVIVDPGVLRPCLEAARKYDLQGMLENIDAQLSQPNSMVLPDPTDLYKLSVDYEMPNSRIKAARKLLGSNYDLLDPTSFTKILATLPSTKYTIALAAVQGARYKIVTNILLLQLSEFVPPHGPPLRAIACDGCLNTIEDAATNRSHLPLPGWVFDWSGATHLALTQSPLEDCLACFEAAFFDHFSTNGDGAICSSCLDCLQTSAEHKANFDLWAYHLKTHIENQLQSLEPLYDLC